MGRGIRWMPHEDAVLLSRYGREPLARIVVELPGRTLKAARMRAIGLGLGRPAPCWTAAEDAVLERCYGQMSMDELLRRLPRRTRPAVYGRVVVLGLSRPTQAAKPTQPARPVAECARGRAWQRLTAAWMGAA